MLSLVLLLWWPKAESRAGRNTEGLSECCLEITHTPSRERAEEFIRNMKMDQAPVTQIRVTRGSLRLDWKRSSEAV